MIASLTPQPTAVIMSKSAPACAFGLFASVFLIAPPLRQLLLSVAVRIPAIVDLGVAPVSHACVRTFVDDSLVWTAAGCGVDDRRARQHGGDDGDAMPLPLS
jgi:hypothetical protein